MDAARAGATFAERRLDTEQRRFDAGLSTSFLVTQAQRDLLQAEVSLLQATLDHQSALVSFEALQKAPALADRRSTSPRGGANVVLMPTSAPRGLFRQLERSRILMEGWPADSQLGHLRLKRRPLHAELGGRSGRTTDEPVGLLERLTDVLAFGFFERAGWKRDNA